MTKTAIIVDIDGTLSNPEHRLHHIRETDPPDWEAFHENVWADPPIEPTCQLIQTICADDDWFVIMMTGRKAKCRPATVRWLCKRGLYYDMLFMRPNDDHQQDVTLKHGWYSLLASGAIDVPGVWLPPKIVIEDRRRVIDMWRELGLVALHCTDGEY